MSNSIEDMQMLRLIKAFQRVRDHDTRREIIRQIEEKAEHEEARSPERTKGEF